MMNNDSLCSLFLSIFVLFSDSKYGYAARINPPLTRKNKLAYIRTRLEFVWGQKMWEGNFSSC